MKKRRRFEVLREENPGVHSESSVKPISSSGRCRNDEDAVPSRRHVLYVVKAEMLKR